MMTFMRLCPLVASPAVFCMTDAPKGVKSIVTHAALVQSKTMKTGLWIFVAGLAVAACSPLSIYYRPGVEVSRMQADATRCEVEALKRAPVATQIRQNPPIYFPGNRYCTGTGCYYGPGYWVDGGIYTVDVNRDLRIRVQNLCMAEKGYQPVTLPRCPARIASAVTPAQTSTLPALSGNSCVIRHDDGRWQIVTPQSPILAE
jgi:hypothetical protein